MRDRGTVPGIQLIHPGRKVMEHAPWKWRAGKNIPLTEEEMRNFDPEEWDPGRADLDLEQELEPLIENFERSRWAGRQPIAVELEVTLPFAGRRLVCKLDAVYRDGEGDDARYEVVDWKSGRMPKNAAERASRFLQLDLYRHAYAAWADIEPERIDVTLFYVAEGEELRGEAMRSLAELEDLWIGAAGRVSAG